jgi:hypothetical protein
MTKKLEGILGGIVESPGSSKANPNYTSEVLTETDDYLKEFSEINLGNAEGLKKYEKLTGAKTKGLFKKEINRDYKQFITHLGETYTGYIDKHINPVTKELSEIARTSIGYEFCPDEKSTKKGYEAVRAIVGMAKETIETIEKDPEEHIEKVITAAPEWMRGIAGRFPDEVCKIDAESSRKRAFRAIGEYDSTKFVTETYGHLRSLGIELQKEESALVKERAELEKDATPYMYATEEANYYKKINEKETALQERASKIADLGKLREIIVGNAIKTIKEKKSIEDKTSEHSIPERKLHIF